MTPIPTRCPTCGTVHALGPEAEAEIERLRTALVAPWRDAERAEWVRELKTRRRTIPGRKPATVLIVQVDDGRGGAHTERLVVALYSDLAEVTEIISGSEQEG